MKYSRGVYPHLPTTVEQVLLPPILPSPFLSFPSLPTPSVGSPGGCHPLEMYEILDACRLIIFGTEMFVCLRAEQNKISTLSIVHLLGRFRRPCNIVQWTAKTPYMQSEA